MPVPIVNIKVKEAPVIPAGIPITIKVKEAPVIPAGIPITVACYAILKAPNDADKVINILSK